ncbi:hypothetical protein GEMRC1_007841 [Eukaryota sp. GEM-RC1]
MLHLHCILLLYFLVSVLHFADGSSLLRDTAIKSLESNIITMKSGKSYLRAASHQFGGLWTRDFAFSVPALLQLGHTSTVRDHIDLILSNLREKDNLVPRLIDDLSLAKRYALALIHQYPMVKEPLTPYYVGGNGGEEAIDGNLLVTIAFFQYVNATNDVEFFNRHKHCVQKCLQFYHSFIREGLIYQNSFSDWADNAKREGHVFLTNLFLWEALELGSKYSLFEDFPHPDVLKAKLKERFVVEEDGITVIKSLIGSDYVSLDSYFFSYYFEFFSPAEQVYMYNQLKFHGVWNCSHGSSSIPGCVSFPSYKDSEISLASKAVGLRHYSDNLYHSFSIAWAGYLARKGHDFKKYGLILDRLSSIVKRDGVIHELFHDDEDLTIFNTLIFHSEFPFTWGSATVVLASV